MRAPLLTEWEILLLSRRGLVALSLVMLKPIVLLWFHVEAVLRDKWWNRGWRKCEDEEGDRMQTDDKWRKKKWTKERKKEKEICEFPHPPLRPPLMPSIHHPASNISYSVAPLLTAELISALITLIGGMLMKERDEAFWDSGLIPLL